MAPDTPSLTRALLPAAAWAGVDAYLSVQTKRAGKVRGEAAAPGHDGDIAVQRWSLGLRSSSAVGANNVSQQRSYTKLTVVKQTDAATTALMSALAANDEVKEAKLSLRRAGDGQQDFLCITLKQARVTEVELGGGAGDNTETIQFAFLDIEVTYRLQQAGGSAGAAFTFTDQLA